jgi:RNA polymerase sigma factor (TIGR02999 family)
MSDGPESDSYLATVHKHLRAMAERQMADERAGHTLQATALVNEAWMSLRDRLDARENPGRFYLAAAESMRRILIDHARRRGAKKRGGDLRRMPLDIVQVAATANLGQVIAIDEAIAALEEVSDRAATVVRLRFFSGLDERETADAMRVSERTVRREWAFARAWLYRRLGSDAEPGAAD